MAFLLMKHYKFNNFIKSLGCLFIHYVSFRSKPCAFGLRLTDIQPHVLFNCTCTKTDQVIFSSIFLNMQSNLLFMYL